MWIPIYITFMLLLMGFVFLLCYIFTRKKKDVNSKNLRTNKNNQEKSLNKKNKQNGSYKKLFPNVMIDDDDETVDDFDKAIDDMIFMDLMDDD